MLILLYTFDVRVLNLFEIEFIQRNTERGEERGREFGGRAERLIVLSLNINEVNLKSGPARGAVPRGSALDLRLMAT